MEAAVTTEPQALAVAVLGLRVVRTADASAGAIRAAAGAVPPEVAGPTAVLLLTLFRFVHAGARAFGDIDDPDTLAFARRWEQLAPWERLGEVAARTDWPLLAERAFDVTLAAERAAARIGAALESPAFTAAPFHFVAETPYGLVDVDGTPGGVTRAARAPALLTIDLAGGDEYAGDAVCQGAAFFGAGVLADAAGSDRYRATYCAQGFGAPLGAGVLVDAAGDDAYDAVDPENRRPSPQSAAHNVSLAQGAGFGLRAGPRASLCGGVGLLAEGGGDDTYRAGVFAQGTGHW